MDSKEEKSKIDQLSLSEVETLLEQEMDELIGGDYKVCNCGLFSANA